MRERLKNRLSNPTRFSLNAIRRVAARSRTPESSFLPDAEEIKGDYQFLSLLDLPVHILNEEPLLTCNEVTSRTRIDYRSLMPCSFARAVVERRGSRESRLDRVRARPLTATLHPYPADLCGNVSCQNGVLLLVVVDERRHVGRGCHWVSPLTTETSEMATSTGRVETPESPRMIGEAQMQASLADWLRQRAARNDTRAN